MEDRPTIRHSLRVAGLCLVLVVFARVSARSFFLPHSRGDQAVYVALAMKLDALGLDGYNLRRVGLRLERGFAQYTLADDETGDLLRLMKEAGVGFYDEPLFHTPPLFAYLLMGAQRVFAPRQPYQLLADAGAAGGLSRAEIARAQFAPCAVPLLAGLALVALTFALGRMWFGDAVGWLAAALVAFSPAVLLAGQRVWADTTLAALVTLAVWLAARAGRDRHLVWLLFSAIALGLATLTKITGALAVWPVLGVVTASGWAVRQRWLAAALFVVVLVGVVGPWFESVRRTYGQVLYNPQQHDIARTQEFFRQLKARPWYSFAIGLPYQAPLFALGYAAAAAGLRRRGWRTPAAMLAVWFVVFGVALTWVTSTNPMLGPEQRYMIPAYPALALLAADATKRLRDGLARRSCAWTANAVVTVLVAGSFAWSAWVAGRALRADDVPLPC
jgi:hypothetical protein